MPELPEVETIRKQLHSKLIGKQWQGRKIVNIRRRAKLLLIDFSDKSSLVFHLKLTGQLLFNGVPGKYTRAVFNFDDGSNLVFNDARKFGWSKHIQNSQAIEKPFGIDALEITLTELKAVFVKKKRTKIKTVLMDQKQLAGIGNIYSDEILFSAKVRPDRLAGTINSQETSKILASVKAILKKAIERRGSSIEYYLDALGQKGDFVSLHRIYHKKQCGKCGGRVERLKINGRTAHYCPKCQQ
ncbi:MAG: DNA-formamidopyrimidine glycosylase family protein [Patescibacteria group bacterium]